MAFEQQKEVAGTWATLFWIGSGLYLYFSTDGVTFISWSALGFFGVGMFVAALVFGALFYGLNRVLAKIFARTIKKPTPTVSSFVQVFGLTLLVAQAVVVFLSASWVFEWIETPTSAIEAEYKSDRENFIEAMNAFTKANQLDQELMAGRASANIPPEDAAEVEALIEKGLYFGNQVNPQFLTQLHPDLPFHFQARLIRGHELLLEGRKNGDFLAQKNGIELISRFYGDFWYAHTEDIISKLE